MRGGIGLRSGSELQKATRYEKGHKQTQKGGRYANHNCFASTSQHGCVGQIKGDGSTESTRAGQINGRHASRSAERGKGEIKNWGEGIHEQWHGKMEGGGKKGPLRTHKETRRQSAQGRK